MHNLYNAQKTTVRTEYGKREWLPIDTSIRQGFILPPYLLNVYAEYIIQKTGLDSEEGGLKMGGRNINNLQYADDTELLVESSNDLK